MDGLIILIKDDEEASTFIVGNLGLSAKGEGGDSGVRFRRHTQVVSSDGTRPGERLAAVVDAGDTAW